MPKRAIEESEDESQQPDEPHPPQWTKGELVDAGGMSPKTFDTVRKAARVKGPQHGGLNHIFSALDLIALIQRAQSGRFSREGKIWAEVWIRMLNEAGLQMPETISRQRRSGEQQKRRH